MEESREKWGAPGLRPAAVLLVALALSIGWGVRGNWGHEYGAMIPGALAAIAAALVSGREDWRGRAHFFAFFGALGWSLGGSMSYMIVIGYTHSGDLESQAYGFACLTLLGFLWGALGGIGTAMPAVLDRERLTAFVFPALVVMAAWVAVGWTLVLGLRLGWIVAEQLHWYGTDWVAAAVAGVVALGFVLFSKVHRVAATLYFLMAAGWWAGFGGLVLGLGLRMTPPRGDNWAGMLGMTVAALLYFAAARQPRIVYAGLVAGFWGGFGFAGMQLVKLAGIATGAETNWHSLLEQGYGFVSGVGIAWALGRLSDRTPAALDEPPARPWVDPAAVAFVLGVIPFLNIRKNVSSVWIPEKVVPEEMYGLSAYAWFHLLYGAVMVVLFWAIVRHHREGLDLLPETSLGRAQALFLVFLWWIVVGNLLRVLPFHPQRMVTEGVIHVNACIASALALLLPRATDRVAQVDAPRLWGMVGKATLVGVLASAATIALETGGVRLLYGDQQAGHAGLHIRFGPNNTNEKQ